MKKEDDSYPDPFINVKVEKIESDEVGSCTDSKNTKYNCTKCNKILSSSRSLKRHVKSFHDDEDKKKIKPEPRTDEETIITCSECNANFATRDECQIHKLVHKTSFECDVCSKTFRTRFRLKVHYVMHMQVKPYLCETCSRPFAR